MRSQQALVALVSSLEDYLAKQNFSAAKHMSDLLRANLLHVKT